MAGSASTSQSTSTSFIPNYPQTAYETNWQNTLSGLQSQQYQWAQNQYNADQNLTSQNVNSYLSGANASQAIANQANNQWSGTYAPLNANFANQAQNWASPDRIQSAMGSAEATSQAGTTAGINNLKQQLQSYGIDPSSPRYAGALAAANTAAGAAAAGAGNQARVATQATGLGLEQAAMNQGNQVAGLGQTATNTGYQGIAGAENAQLANTASGANILGTSLGYATQGVNAIKFPPLGTQSQSTTQSISSSPNASNSQGSQGSQGSQSSPSSSSTGNTGGYNTGYTSTDGSQLLSQDQSTTQDPSQYTGAFDPNMLTSPDMTGGTGGFDPNAYQSTDPSQSFTDQSSFGPNTGSFDASSSGGFAEGGAIPDDAGDLPDNATTGGFVSHAMSPSGGADTDDVEAKVNAGEFVVPRDVTEWKGHEFFQKLIDQSRMARQGGSAKPTMGGGAKKPNLKQAVTQLRASSGGAIPDTIGAGTAAPMQRYA